MIFEPLAHEKGLRLVVEVADDVPEVVQTDGQRTRADPRATCWATRSSSRRAARSRSG